MIINNKAYDWADVDFSLPGFSIEPQEISYDDELEKEAVYGLGNKPRGYGSGNYKANFKTTFLRDDFNDMIDYCKSNGINFYDMVLDKAVISYGNDNQPIVTDIITKITPTKKSNSAKQGDKSFTVEVEWLVFGEIITNGVKSV